MSRKGTSSSPGSAANASSGSASQAARAAAAEEPAFKASRRVGWVIFSFLILLRDSDISQFNRREQRKQRFGILLCFPRLLVFHFRSMVRGFSVTRRIRPQI